MDYSLEKSGYSITLNFKKQTEDPARLFHTMGTTIEVFTNFDVLAFDCLRVSGRPVAYVDDILTSSIIAKIFVFLKGIDDQAIRDCDIKRIIGSFLVQCKFSLLDWMEKKTTVEQKKEIIELQNSIEKAAQNSDVKRIKSTEKPRLKDISYILVDLSEIISRLPDDSSISLTSKGKTSFLPKGFKFNKNDLEKILVDEVITEHYDGPVLVRKPDFIKDSTSWQMRLNNRYVDVKIEDYNWLGRFLSQDTIVKPGDSLDAKVTTKKKISSDGELIAESHVIEKVNGVIQAPIQLSLPGM